jgi:enamine deaminase RidA (YjgF/YER057c/UK114 family)
VTRRSIDIQSFAHANPIPAACQIGPLLVSSIIAPRDPGGPTIPEDVGAQLANLFHHAGEILEAAGFGWDDVARMTFYVPDIAVRDAINAPWVERFPDATSRPARFTQVSPAGGKMVTCELLAFRAG